VRVLTLGGEIRDDLVTAPVLLDFCAFAAAVVLSERIVHLPYVEDSAALNTALGEPVLTPLPVVPFDRAEAGPYDDGLHGVAATLGNVLSDAIRETGALSRARPGELLYADQRATADRWGAVLGRRIQPEALWYHRESSHWNSDGPGLLARLLAHQQNADDLEGWAQAPQWMESLAESDPTDEGLAGFIGECNTRSFFNLRVASMLGVPYVGNATRLPIRHHQYRRAARIHRELLLSVELDASVQRHRAAYLAPERPNVHLPVFGALALRRAGARGDLLDALATLRADAARLRARRAEYDEVLRGPDATKADKLRQAMADDSGRLTSGLAAPAAAGLAAVLAATSGPTTLTAIAGIGALTALGAMSEETRRVVLRRLFRPTHWWLTDTAGTARSIASSAADLQRLFDLGDEAVDTCRRRLEQLAAVGLA
jgi:hypothetical protein